MDHRLRQTGAEIECVERSTKLVDRRRVLRIAAGGIREQLVEKRDVLSAATAIEREVVPTTALPVRRVVQRKPVKLSEHLARPL